MRREAKGLEHTTTELVSNSLTYAIVLLQWTLSFFMDSQPEYVIGAGICIIFYLMMFHLISWTIDHHYARLVAGL